MFFDKVFLGVGQALIGFTEEGTSRIISLSIGEQVNRVSVVVLQ